MLRRLQTGLLICAASMSISTCAILILEKLEARRRGPSLKDNPRGWLKHHVKSEEFFRYLEGDIKARYPDAEDASAVLAAIARGTFSILSLPPALQETFKHLSYKQIQNYRPKAEVIRLNKLGISGVTFTQSLVHYWAENGCLDLPLINRYIGLCGYVAANSYESFKEMERKALDGVDEREQDLENSSTHEQLTVQPMPSVNLSPFLLNSFYKAPVQRQPEVDIALNYDDRYDLTPLSVYQACSADADFFNYVVSDPARAYLCPARLLNAYKQVIIDAYRSSMSSDCLPHDCDDDHPFLLRWRRQMEVRDSLEKQLREILDLKENSDSQEEEKSDSNTFSRP